MNPAVSTFFRETHKGIYLYFLRKTTHFTVKLRFVLFWIVY